MLQKTAFFIAILWTSLIRAQTLTVSAAISLKEAMNDIARQYQAATGDTIDLNFGASGTLAVQIQQGAPVDLFISASPREVNELIADGLADASTRQVVAANKLVLIVPAHFPNPPDKFADLTDSRFHHIAIGEPKVVPAGDYAMQTLKSLGLDQTLSPKLIMGENVRQVLSYVMRGEADAGIVYSTDAIAAGDSIRLAATAPSSTHNPIIYPAIIIKAGKRDPAGKFLQYMKSATAQAVFVARGFALPPLPATRP